MFGRKKDNSEDTLDSRQRALNNNMLLSIGAFVLLTYQFIQILFDERNAPIWFLIVMPMILICTLFFVWRNIKQIKKIKQQIADDEASMNSEVNEFSDLSIEAESKATREESKYDE